MVHLGNTSLLWWEHEVQGKQPLGSGEAGEIGPVISYQRVSFFYHGEAVIGFMFQKDCSLAVQKGNELGRNERVIGLWS